MMGTLRVTNPTVVKQEFPVPHLYLPFPAILVFSSGSFSACPRPIPPGPSSDGSFSRDPCWMSWLSSGLTLLPPPPPTWLPGLKPGVTHNAHPSHHSWPCSLLDNCIPGQETGLSPALLQHAALCPFSGTESEPVDKWLNE